MSIDLSGVPVSRCQEMVEATTSGGTVVSSVDRATGAVRIEMSLPSEELFPEGGGGDAGLMKQFFSATVVLEMPYPIADTNGALLDDLIVEWDFVNNTGTFYVQTVNADGTVPDGIEVGEPGEYTEQTTETTAVVSEDDSEVVTTQPECSPDEQSVDGECQIVTPTTVVPPTTTTTTTEPPTTTTTVAELETTSTTVIGKIEDLPPPVTQTEEPGTNWGILWVLGALGVGGLLAIWGKGLVGKLKKNRTGEITGDGTGSE